MGLKATTAKGQRVRLSKDPVWFMYSPPTQEHKLWISTTLLLQKPLCRNPGDAAAPRHKGKGTSPPTTILHQHLEVLPRRLGSSQTGEVNQCEQDVMPTAASACWVWELAWAHSNQLLQLKCSFCQRVKPAHSDRHHTCAPLSFAASTEGCHWASSGIFPFLPWVWRVACYWINRQARSWERSGFIMSKRKQLIPHMYIIGPDFH